MNIQTANLDKLLELEPFFILSGFMILVWLCYKLFLRDASLERHTNIRQQFRSIFRHYLVLATGFSFLTLAKDAFQLQEGRITTLVGLVTLCWGMIVFVKSFRLLILMYLFLGSMRAGVPVLIVNIFSLLMSLGLLIWTANHIFGVDVGPLLATSAAFSVVLGFAMQDTLGNLFAGISLQLDKSFEIGDWIEVQSGVQKAVGQVREITWRATVIVGLNDEYITLPNRFLAGAQIANFSDGDRPFIRTQIFRVDHEVQVQTVKEILTEAAIQVPDVLRYPEPFSYVAESNENGVNVKLVYFLDKYGSQWRIGDLILDKALHALKKNHIALTPNKILVMESAK